GGCGGGVERPVLGQHHYLADLAPGHVVAWAELQAVGATGVARDDAVVVSGLYVLVEGISSRHVSERRGRRGVYGPALGQHRYLADLAAGGEVVGAEGVVPVAGDDPAAMEVAHRLIEVVRRAYVREREVTI